ncbi:hypothetical protein BC938DRAFT_477561, partial [Jimgerdemannia flammicorona]
MDLCAQIWKLLMLQKPIEVTAILKTRIKGLENRDLVDGFAKLVEMDLITFLLWLDSRKIELNVLFQENISKNWEAIIAQENKISKEVVKINQAKRMNKLKRLLKRNNTEEDVMSQYMLKTYAWSRSIQEIENSRFTKVLQDNDGQDNFISSEWAKSSADMFRERSIWGRNSALEERKWRLDFTE